MPWTSKHLKWLVKSGELINTAEGKSIEIWELRHQNDEEILSAWAKHFRNHYCLDAEIDQIRQGTSYSRADYLNRIKFPHQSVAPGPSIRAGDFGEILVADYLQYLLGFWVPRNRYANKDVRNESTKGCDILGFKFLRSGREEIADILAIYETKAQFSGSRALPTLQAAVDGSAKNYERKAESLNAIKQRFIEKKMLTDAQKIEKFQNPEDRPYREIYGAAALFSTSVFDKEIITSTTTSNYPYLDQLFFLVIYGANMMNLVHELYRRAADEA